MRVGAAALVALALAASATTAAAEEPSGEPAPVSKKQRFLDSKRGAPAVEESVREQELARWHRQLDRMLGRPPEAVVNIYNGWTHETLPATAGKPAEKALGIPQSVIDHFFRCRWTSRTTDMDPALFPTLVAAANHFGVDRVFVVSAFRSTKFNLMLQKKGHQVGRESRHILGKAVDFRLPGVSTSRLRKWAKSLVLGGVGFYPKSRMIHVDTDRVRYWEGD